jgi:hypothetical protein
MMPMIHVEPIDLGLTLPSTEVGMVIAQPFLDLEQHEPFSCTAKAKPALLATIQSTLQVARSASHGAGKTHFTIFPECSVPGPEGIAIIHEVVCAADWPVGTVVIAGVDALSKAQFTALTEDPRTRYDAKHNALNRMTDQQWVNCCITWAKGDDGTVTRWLQPKIVPAFVELDVQCKAMFRGESVYVFTGAFTNQSTYRFCSLVCFDWVGPVGGKKVWQWMVEGLGQLANAAKAAFPLSWVFVIQHNPKPSHTSFLAEVADFFDPNTVASVPRQQTCLVFANNAGNKTPGRAELFGNTALVFSSRAQFKKPTCFPTYCNGGQRERKSPQLGPFFDVLFRERGACIHSFVHANPEFVLPGAAGKAFPVTQPFVYPLNGCQDPRVPSGTVPASIKWLNDELDEVACLATYSPHAALVAQAQASRGPIVSALRAIDGVAVQGTMSMACALHGISGPSNNPPKERSPDDWDVDEHCALEHLMHTLQIFATGLANPHVQGQPAHAQITLGTETIDVLAVIGKSHEDCYEHVKNNLPASRRPVALVSRDHNNNPRNKRFRSILDTSTEAVHGERKFTDPTSAVRQVGYRELLDAFQETATQHDMNGALHAAFG